MMRTTQLPIQSLESNDGDMAEWIETYLDMVDMLLNVIHFQRVGNWNGYLQAIKKFLPYCFACNRHNYARNLRFYYMHMLNLRNDNPLLQQYLEREGFTGSVTGKPHSRLPMDQIIEVTINRSSKSTGGLSGKTQNVGAMTKWTRINHYLCVLAEHQQNNRTKRKV